MQEERKTAPAVSGRRKKVEWRLATTAGLVLLALSALGVVVARESAPAATKKMVEKTAVQSADVLELGPEGVLFIGDSMTGVVHALELGAREGDLASPFNLDGIERRLAEALDAAADQVRINDVAVYPSSGEAVLAVTRGLGEGARPFLAFVKQAGQVELIDLQKAKTSRAEIVDRPDPDLIFWDETPARTYTITDLEWHDGRLFISGLSNGEFASVLRWVHYPFKGKVATSSVAMYHAVHNQTETRAPIESLEIAVLDGEPHIVAAYLCTPIVTVPLTSLEDGGHVVGKTIGELGWGNQPIDLLHFNVQVPWMDGPQFLLTNKQRHSMIMTQKAVEEYNRKKGLDSPVPFPMQSHAGLPFTSIPFGHVSHVADQNGEFIVALTRHKLSGELELSSRRKGLFLRISEFVDEYDFPDYDYATAPNAEFQAKYLQPTRSMLMRDEGFEEHIK